MKIEEFYEAECDCGSSIKTRLGIQDSEKDLSSDIGSCTTCKKDYKKKKKIKRKIDDDTFEIIPEDEVEVL